VFTDVLDEPCVAFFPFVGAGVPGPARKFRKSLLSAAVERAVRVFTTLSLHPSTEAESFWGTVRLGHSGVTVVIDIFDEPCVALLPFVGVGVPGPARKFRKPLLSAWVKRSVREITTLDADPLSKSVAIDCHRSRNSGVAVFTDVLDEP
jgi:hypothetical protein